MQILINFILVVATIAGMELLSWFIHKYLFHGPLWFIHKSHHQVNHSTFELNDVFSLGFGVAAIWLIIQGLPQSDYRLWLGVGISIYGIIYFVFHDGFIHRRFNTIQFRGRYLLAIRRAHKIHHKSLRKSPSSEFGLLFTSFENFKAVKTNKNSFHLVSKNIDASDPGKRSTQKS